MRSIFKSEFNKEDSVYAVQYTSNSKIFIVNRDSFKKEWLALVTSPEDQQNLTKVDCDFLWLIASDKAETNFSLEPKVVNKVEYKKESNFSNEAFKGFEAVNDQSKKEFRTRAKLSKMVGQDKENNGGISLKVSVNQKENGKGS